MPMTSFTPGRASHLRADRRRPAGLQHRQGQRLRLEIIEQEALIELQLGCDCGAVDRPGRIGQLDLAPLDRAGGAGDQGARPDAEALEGRRQRSLEARMRRRLARKTGKERRIGAHLQSEARIGAADVAKNDGEGKVQMVSLLRGE